MESEISQLEMPTHQFWTMASVVQYVQQEIMGQNYKMRWFVSESGLCSLQLCVIQNMQYHTESSLVLSLVGVSPAG